MTKITKAILPVAGLGTRFLPATKAQPKEMLPVFDTPGIQLIVQDAVDAGITDIIIVTGKEKRAIDDHFDRNPWLEQQLENKGKTKELEMVKNISEMANFAYVRQPQPLGDGHAILQARQFANDEPCVVLFGDDIVRNKDGKNAVQQMLDLYDKVNSPIVMLEEVEGEAIEKYGVVSGAADEHGFKVDGFVEKPKLADAPSRYGAVGKYIITPEIWQILDTAPPSADGEIRLANAFEAYLAKGYSMYGKVLEGQRFDTGDKLGFLKATISYAMDNDEISKELKNFISDL